MNASDKFYIFLQTVFSSPSYIPTCGHSTAIPLKASKMAILLLLPCSRTHFIQALCNYPQLPLSKLFNSIYTTPYTRPSAVSFFYSLLGLQFVQPTGTLCQPISYRPPAVTIKPAKYL